MNSTGRFSLICVSVFALLLTGLFVGATPASADRSGRASAFYTSFPAAGGPYITAATLRGDTLRVVFNEHVADVEDHDFTTIGFRFDGAAPVSFTMRDIPSAGDQRVVDIRGFLAGNLPQVGDYIALATIADSANADGVDGSNTVPGPDHTRVPLTTGPVIVSAYVHVTADGNEWFLLPPDPDANYIYLMFDAPLNDGDWTEADFLGSPELAAVGAQNPPDITITLVAGAFRNVLRIEWTADGHFRQLWPGTSKFHLAAGAVRWDGQATNNNVAQKIMLDNHWEGVDTHDAGPILLGGHWNDVTSTLWLVFSEPIDPSSLNADASTQYTLAGGAAWNGAATQGPGFGGKTNVVAVNAPSATGMDGGTIQVTAGQELTDYQGQEGPQANVVTMVQGIGMVRASYDDNNTPTTPADDVLDVWFSEHFDNTANVDSTDFTFVPNGDLADTLWEDVIISANNDGSGYGRVRVTGWQNVDLLDGGRLAVGAYLKIRDGSDLAGQVSSLDSVNVNLRLTICEDQLIWPSTPFVQEVGEFTSKYYDPGPPPIDNAYLAWREIGTSDPVDHWLLFYTKAGAGSLNDLMIINYIDNATPVSDLHSQILDDGVQRMHVSILAGTWTTDDLGHVDPLVDGDQVWFMMVPVTYWGAVGNASSSLRFTRSFFVGPVCLPQDCVANTDDDMIHAGATLVIAGTPPATSWTYWVAGDPNSAPCGDSIYVYDIHPDSTGAVVVGRGLINGSAGFEAIELDSVCADSSNIWLVAAEDGVQSSALEILIDKVFPTLMLDGNDLVANPDRFNPYRIYTKDDHINILLKAYDGLGDSTQALNDLLTVTADFSRIDRRVVTTGGDSVHAIALVGLGGDQIDNDGDWVDSDVDGVMDFSEPYFDENGNGQFDLGETFGDLNGNDLYDGAGGSGTDFDANLDAADPDEHGWYEIQLTTSADSSNVTKGFKVEDPRTQPNGHGGFIDLIDAVFLALNDDDYDLVTAYDTLATPKMTVEIDENPPTVSKITSLKVAPAKDADPGNEENLILPTDPTYALGRYVHFNVDDSLGVPSDDDVFFGIAQLYTQRSGSWAWEALSLDPPGVNADAGYPGVFEFDDDDDITNAAGVDTMRTNGLDEDEDGTPDNAEEGIDLHDPEVVDAAQDSTADANAPGGDGVYRTTDRKDNDGDAFYIFEPFYDPDPGTADDAFQRIVWYNIDESPTNNIDDDNDGVVDNVEEVENYTAAYDDNEDGIMDGQMVTITVDNVRMFVVASDSTWTSIEVPASSVLGTHSADNDGDIRALTEFIDPGYGTLGQQLLPWTQNLWTLDFGQSTPADSLSWFGTFGENIDFEYIAQLYDMTADGVAEYQMRAVAYDQAGLAEPAYAMPITFTIDVNAPGVLEITNCSDGDPETGPPDFVDVHPGNGVLEIHDTGSYTLTVTDDPDAVEVRFEWRYSEDEGNTWASWVTLGTDVSVPYTTEFDADALVTIANDPPDASWLVEFRAIARDAFNNEQDPGSVCVLPVTVIDGTPPFTWFTLIHTTANPDTTVYYYRDTIGPMQVPVGPAIAIHANYDDNDGSVPADTTNDVTQVVFQYRPVGAGPGAEWTHFETVMGTIVIDPETGDTLSVDMTRPVAVTLDTESMGTGSFDIRVYACDIERNCNILTADIATITVIEEGLRAYIENPRLGGATGEVDLWAFNYIHDVEIDKVEFQYYVDTDGDGIDNDSGSQWLTITIDGAATDRGDVVLRRGTTAYYNLSGHVGFQALGVDSAEAFVDYDADGYSERDPIVRDRTGGTWGIYDAGIDEVIVGDPQDGDPLTDFAAEEFHSGVGPFTSADWVFKDNALTGGAALELWQTTWDVIGLSGDYVLRSVATDEFGTVDDSVTSPSVIPMVPWRIDPDAPATSITLLTLPDGSTIDPSAVASIYINGSTGWFKMEAESPDSDIYNMLFQWSDDGGATWTDLDLNDDDDFYADIDDTLGWSGADEIILDDGDYVFGPGDVVLYDGGNGVVNTPLDTPLLPLIGEDPANAIDDDHDGMTDEDGDVEKEDYDSPYFVYFDAFNFVGDTDIRVRAVATDQSGNVDATLAEMLSILIGESVPPLTDIIWVQNTLGEEIDVFPTVADGDGVALVDTSATNVTLRAFFTGDDGTATYDLMWRPRASCYPDLDPWDNPWRSMSDDGFATFVTGSLYEYTIDLKTFVETFGDQVIEFYPQGTDANSNGTLPPENPYALRILTNSAGILAAGLPPTVSEGDEVWFEATLAAPNDDAVVTFYYANRVMDGPIDASRVSQATPYISQALDPPLVGMPAGNHAILKINDVEGTYHDDLSAVPNPDKYDWTMNGTAVEFGAPPAATDVILISYNISTYAQIGVGDSHAPYTVAWDAANGGVPAPMTGAEAYDIIATMSVSSGDECGLLEEQITELAVIGLIYTDAPVVELYMKGVCNDAPGDYWPGNPSFDSVAGMTEWKISGIEAEAFVKTDDLGIDSVSVVFIHPGGAETYVPMALYNIEQETVGMTFTMYEKDYTVLDLLYDVENVTLHLGGNEYAMTNTETGVWQVANVPVAVGDSTSYAFEIDMVGNDFAMTDDYRNVSVISDTSSVNVPPTPFWHAMLDTRTLLGTETEVWRVKAVATDTDLNVGTDGPHPFVYDPVAPTVDALTASSLRFNENETVMVVADVTDPTPGDFNVITVAQVVFEYCPNYAAAEADRVWLNFGTDNDPGNGWWATGTILDPEIDNYDNDDDGEWDEADEATSLMAFRAIARDDGMNYGDATILEFVLDSTEPTAIMTAPLNGAVYPYSGGGFTLSADITESEGDVEYVLFKCIKGTAPGDTVDVDITPEDNSDDPWDPTAPYEVTFDPADYLTEGQDVYVRFFTVPHDSAGNDGTCPEVLVIIDDITGPTGYPIQATTTGGAGALPFTDPHLAVRGDAVLIEGSAIDPAGWDMLARVDVEYQAPGSADWVLIATDVTLVQVDALTVEWGVIWNTDGLLEGDYKIRARAWDIDSNYDETPLEVSLAVDNTGPSVSYDPIAGYYDGFARWAWYQNDGVPSDSSRSFVPDADTGDLTFMIITPDTDVESVAIQWHKDGVHGLGEWQAITVGAPLAFDYQPNLAFTYNATTYQVWRLRMDNFRDACANHVPVISGVVEMRALATDYAGNANVLHDANNMWSTWTVDVDDPAPVSFTHNLEDDQVSSGDDVTVLLESTDGTTDVAKVRFEYKPTAGALWTVIDPDPATPEIETVPITAQNLDTAYPRWLAEVTWTTPYPLTIDTSYDIKARFYDIAGNWNETTLSITVADNIKPDLTKMWAIPGEVMFVDDPSGIANEYDFDCEGDAHDGLFVDRNDDDTYTQGTDIAIDYGDDGLILTSPSNSDGALGSTMFTWPRWIDENVIGGTNEIVVSNQVTLVARTQNLDDGLERVEFWAVNAAEEQILIKVDECVPDYGQFGVGPLWHVIWNTEEVDEHGNPRFPDGTYTIVARAYDLEGNIEDWDLEGAATVYVDNTAPQATPDLDPLTEEIEATIDVERNDPFTLFARTMSERDDDIVTFWTKPARDLNQAGVWAVVPNTEGVDTSDVNPDPTRPYVFDWNLNLTDPPLVVGESYHMAPSVMDIVGNGEAVTDAFDDARYVTFTVVDTKAPVATITEVVRATGDTTPIVLPHEMDEVRARDFETLTATLLNCENDAIKVEFMYAAEGYTTPTLIDAQVAPGDDPHTWEISQWDLAAMAEGTYDVFAVATDDVGNVDFDEETGRPKVGPVFKLVVDRTAPVFTVVKPSQFDGMMACPDDTTTGEYELILTSTDTDVWHDGVVWQYKLALMPDCDTCWIATGQPVIFDANSGGWASRWAPAVADGLYDLRVTVRDLAGNEQMDFAARNMVIDTTAPEVNVTRFVVAGADIYPTGNVDITLGEVITVWATAADDEAALPDNYETGVTDILFQARRTTGSQTGWMDVGLWHAPDGTVYPQVEASIDWNTTGLLEGTYDVRAVAMDAVCNKGPSSAVTINVMDWVPARARIAGWYPWVVPHGDDPTTYCEIYALGYCDDRIAEIQFQYMPFGGDSWIPIGIAWQEQENLYGVEDDVWGTRIDLGEFTVGDTLTLRAVATDAEDNEDEDPPTMDAVVWAHTDGALDLMGVNYDQVSDPLLLMVGGETPTEIIVEVTMKDGTQMPHVLAVTPTGNDSTGAAGWVAMARMVDDAMSWRGSFVIPQSHCGKTTVFASALSGERIDLHSTQVRSYEVTNALGSNGTVTVPGYVASDTLMYYLNATADIPSGNGGMANCLFMLATDAPQMDVDQARYMTLIPRSAYYIGFPENTFQLGYPGTFSIEYDDAALEEAFGDAATAAEKEQFLTVRAWHRDNGWQGPHISHISVDTDNNRLTFRMNRLEGYEPVLALFAPALHAPVVVSSFTPHSPYAGRWNYTDIDPVIVAYLNSTGPDAIDASKVEVWIDGHLMASSVWVRGNGTLAVNQAHPDGTIYEVIYQHSTQAQDQLVEYADGHLLNIMYKYAAQGPDEWVSLPPEAPGARFYVDATPPVVEFHGGWVSNPLLSNVAGYLSPTQADDMLTVRLYDERTGIMVRPVRFGAGCEDEEDYGIKYDLWLVDGEDDQADIDEIEERVLLHQGTADELLPYLEPPLVLVPGEEQTATYMPSDMLVVGLPIVGGGAIKDNDVLEVTIYSHKQIEQNNDGTGIGGDVDTITVNGETILVYGDIFYDSESQEMHIYDYSIFDWAGNCGSKYVEQRFIVDMSGPSVDLIVPASGSTVPGRAFSFEVALTDGGAGVESAEAELIDPQGEAVEITDLVVTTEKITGTVEEGLGMGTHILKVTATDQAGNVSTTDVRIVIESSVLGLSDTYIYPNPFNPDDIWGKVHFQLSRRATVRIKVYDFAGDYVTTLPRQSYDQPGSYEIAWAGQAADGTDLANGAYLIRIEAHDGSATKGATVKAVIWRE